MERAGEGRRVKRGVGRVEPAAEMMPSHFLGDVAVPRDSLEAFRSNLATCSVVRRLPRTASSLVAARTAAAERPGTRTGSESGLAEQAVDLPCSFGEELRRFVGRSDCSCSISLRLSVALRSRFGRPAEDSESEAMLRV